MLFDKIVRTPVGTDSSRPYSGIEGPKGRDESVPTDIRTNLFNRIITSFCIEYQGAWVGAWIVTILPFVYALIAVVFILVLSTVPSTVSRLTLLSLARLPRSCGSKLRYASLIRSYTSSHL